MPKIIKISMQYFAEPANNPDDDPDNNKNQDGQQNQNNSGQQQNNVMIIKIRIKLNRILSQSLIL